MDKRKVRKDMKGQYKYFSQFLQKGRDKTDRPFMANTRVIRTDENTIKIRLYETYIVTLKANGDCILNSGGYRTVTTKGRMNEVLPPGYHVSQNRSVWYVNGVPYFDNMVLPKDLVPNNRAKQEEKRVKDLTNKIKVFVDYVIKQMIDRKVPDPSSGDCWLCLMVDSDKKSWGEISKDQSHLLSHMKEKYVVPSMILNAIRSQCRDENHIWSIYRAYRDEGSCYFGSCTWTIKNALTVYLKRSLAIPY